MNKSKIYFLGVKKVYSDYHDVTTILWDNVRLGSIVQYNGTIRVERYDIEEPYDVESKNEGLKSIFERFFDTKKEELYYHEIEVNMSDFAKFSTFIK